MNGLTGLFDPIKLDQASNVAKVFNTGASTDLLPCFGKNSKERFSKPLNNQQHCMTCEQFLLTLI